MALKRILAHPNPPYLKSDFTGNAFGKLELFKAGTTTPKIAFTNATGTSYGSTIDLDSAGLPDLGPIYWDTDELYKVEVYKRVDNAPTYELDYTVDNFGDTFSAIPTDLNNNLVSNASFETVSSISGQVFENWTNFGTLANVERDVIDSNHGVAAVKFTSSNGDEYLRSHQFEISPQKNLQIDFVIKAENVAAQPAIIVFWLGADLVEIGNEYIYRSTANLTPTSWTLIEGLTATPPAAARYAQIRVVGNESGTSYITRFDGMNVSQQSPSVGEAVAGVIPIGLELLLSATDSDNDITVSAGTVLDSTLTSKIVLREAITKQKDVGWTGGDANGGLFAGSTIVPNLGLGVYLIKNSDTGEVDVGFDTATDLIPTLPAGFDTYRYLGWAAIDGSNNFYVQKWVGSTNIQLREVESFQDAAVAASATFFEATISVPPECIFKYGCHATTLTNDFTNDLRIRTRPIGSNFTTGQGIDDSAPAAGAFDDMFIEGEVFVDEDQKFEYALDVSSSVITTWQLTYYARGWDDLRRNNPSA